MEAADLARVVAGLRALFARGGTFRQAADELAVPRSTLHRLADRYKIPRRRLGLSLARRRQVLRCVAAGEGGRQIARHANVSRRTAYRYQYRAILTRFKSLTVPLPCKPWRCPGGGELLNVSICIVHGTRKPAGTSKTPRR